MSEATQTSQRFVQIDEEGYFKFDELRVTDPDYGQELLKSLRMNERGVPVVRAQGQDAIVEPFDEPYVARNIEPGTDEVWKILLPYDHSATFRLDTLSVDEWDRFHGRTENGIPFVLSRPAQAAFFELVDEFDDDSVTVKGRRIEIGPWLTPTPAVSDNEFWSKIYRSESPGWDLQGSHEALQALLPRLKLSRSRILVLGAGAGHDAAFFAQHGHLVTAVDFSPEAVAQAKSKYGDLPNLKIVQADVFNLPPEMVGQFDVVFEHTAYCAVDPSRRRDLVKVWRRALIDNGHLLGIFFGFDKRTGPPFGGSEWELRARLGKSFRPLLWNRWHQSIEKRVGIEFVVYAQKLPGI